MPTENTGPNNLTPWLKGQSGNPGGRPKVREELAARIREFGPDLVDRLLAIANGRAEPERAAPSAGEQTKAIQLLLAYGYGRPTDYVEVAGENGGPLRIEVDELLVLTTGELRKRLAALTADGAKTTKG